MRLMYERGRRGTRDLSGAPLNAGCGARMMSAPSRVGTSSSRRALPWKLHRLSDTQTPKHPDTQTDTQADTQAVRHTNSQTDLIIV